MKSPARDGDSEAGGRSGSGEAMPVLVEVAVLWEVAALFDTPPP
jgi:hypothetical protein